MRISALFINHNSDGTILKSIQAIMEQDFPFERVLVIDNGSTDGGPQQILRAFPNVEVIQLEENQGLSRARNIGLKRLESDLVLLLDDDVYLSKGALRLMVDAHLETGAAITCPRIVLLPETNTLQCDGAGIHFTGTLSLWHAYQPVDLHPPVRAMGNGFIGACLLVDRNVLDELGYFDEDYFFYFEDMELSYRVLALGYKICCEEHAVVYHERGEGTKNLSFRGIGSYPKKRAHFNLRNRWLTILIHYQARTLLLLFPAMMIYEFAAFVETTGRGWLKEYFYALVSLIREGTSILKRRKRWQSQRILPDSVILAGGDLPLARGFVNEKRSWLVYLLNSLLNLHWDRIKKWL
jgi:GT2 family glycosyltransferase